MNLDSKREFRQYVLERDAYKCQACFTEDFLTVHHIVPKHLNRALWTETDNGITLCRDCHDEIHGIKRRRKEG